MRITDQSVRVGGILSILAVVALCCVPSRSSRAATITVMSTADSGTGSLRAALTSAANGDTIDASSITGTILLTSGELHVTKSVNLIGPGPTNLAVDGNGTGRVFHIEGFGNIAVTISGLTITNGFVGLSSPLQRGGGIYNQSVLALNTCILSGNSAYSGAAIYNEGPCPPEVICTPERGDGRLTVNNSTLTGNFALYGGGVCSDGSVNIVNSTFSRNLVAGEGGGVLNGAPLNRGVMTIVNSSFSDNSAGRGGGVSNLGDSLGITNSTFSGNWADAYMFGGGGGIHNSRSLTVRSCTFNGNSAYVNGGAVYSEGVANIGSTILNAGVSGANLVGVITSLGYNLSSDNGGGYLTAAGDQINTDPKLGPLKDNGGPTFTHALLPGSPAIDAGDPSFTPPPDFDQRGPGFLRVVNGRIDIGAFEFTPDLLITAAERIGDDLRITFGVALLGENYEVQSRTNLTSGSWETLPGSIPGNGGAVQTILTNTFVVPERFFRIHQFP